MNKYEFTKNDLRFGGEHYQRIVAKGNGLHYTKYINRPLAWFFTKRLYNFSPNSVSLFAFIVMLVGLILIDPTISLVHAIILYFIIALNYVLDSVDGQIARLTKQGSPLGEWLDHSLDALRLVILNAYLINLLVKVPDFSPFVFCALVGQVGLYTVGILRDKILNVDISKEIRNGNRFSPLILTITSIIDHGIFVMIFLLASYPALLMGVYVLWGIFNCLLLVVTMILIFRSSKKNDSK